MMKQDPVLPQTLPLYPRIIREALAAGRILPSQACVLNQMYRVAKPTELLKMLYRYEEMNHPVSLGAVDESGFHMSSFCYSSRSSRYAKENIVKVLEEALAIVKGDLGKEELAFLGGEYQYYE